MNIVSNYFIKKRYLELLYSAFPSNLKDDLKVVFNIIEIDNNFHSGHKGIYKVKKLVSDTYTYHYIDGKKIVLPDRIYFNEPNELKKKTLTTLQHQILNCIFLLSANGYVREKNLRELGDELPGWTIPYLIGNLGGYVAEILIELNNKLSISNIEVFCHYISENQTFWEKTKKRVVSYWNEYYRIDNPFFKNYIGYEIIEKIEKSIHK